MNNGLEQRMIDFAEGTGKFVTDFVSAYKKFETATKVDADMQRQINNTLEMTNEQIEEEIEKLDKEMEIDQGYEESAINPLDEEFNKWQDEADKKAATDNDAATARYEASRMRRAIKLQELEDNKVKKERLESVLEYRYNVAVAAAELDKAMQYLEAKLHDVEKANVIGLANSQLMLNEAENSLSSRKNSEKIQKFVKNYEYFTNILNSVHEVLPSGLDRAVAKFDKSRRKNKTVEYDGELYDITPEQIAAVNELINEGYSKNEDKINAIRFDGIDQLQMDMERKSEELTNDFSKPRFEYELNGDKVRLNLRASGRNYKFDTELDLKDIELSDVKKIFAALVAKYVKSTSKSESDLLYIPFELGHVVGKNFETKNHMINLSNDMSKAIEIIPNRLGNEYSVDYQYSNIAEMLYEQLEGYKKEQDLLSDIDLEEEKEQEIVPEEPVPEQTVEEPVPEEPTVEEPVPEEPVPEEPTPEQPVEEEKEENDFQPPAVVEQPVKENEVPTSNVDDNEEEKENDNGFKVTGSRKFKNLVVGNDNQNTQREGVAAKNTKHENFKKSKKWLIAGGAIAGSLLFVTCTPVWACTFLAGANLLGIGSANMDNIKKKCKIHKLKKIAKKLDCDLRYNITETTNEMFLVDENGNRVTNADIERMAIENGESNKYRDAIAALNKLAKNELRGKDANGNVIENRTDEEIENDPLNNTPTLSEKNDRKHDRKIVKKIIRGLKNYGVDVKDEFDELVSVYETEGIKGLADTIGVEAAVDAGLSNKEVEKAKDLVKDIEKEYRENISWLEIRKHSREDLCQANFDNLMGVFDEMGGLKLSKKAAKKVAQEERRQLENSSEEMKVPTLGEEFDDLEEEQEVEMVEAVPENAAPAEEEPVPEEPKGPTEGTSEYLADEVNKILMEESLEQSAKAEEPISENNEESIVENATVNPSEDTIDIDVESLVGEVVGSTITPPTQLTPPTSFIDVEESELRPLNVAPSIEEPVDNSVSEQTESVVEPVQVVPETQTTVQPTAKSAGELLEEFAQIRDYNPELLQEFMDNNIDANRILQPAYDEYIASQAPSVDQSNGLGM